MGKASRKKRQKELQVKSILKDKPSEAGETSAKKSLYRNPLFHIVLVTIIGILAYSNTFNVPFVFDDILNIVENYKIKDISNFWPPSGSRWLGFLTFALNYHFGGLNTFGYHIVNLTIHILNAILVYWLVVLTYRTPYFKVSVISASVSNQPNQFNLSTFQPFNYLPLFIALLFVSHPIQTQAVTYIVQRFTSLAAFFYLLSLVMYIKFRIHDTRYTIQDKKSKNRESCIMHHASEPKLYATRYTLYAVSLISAILAMKTKEISFTLPFIIILYELMFFEGKIKRRILYLIPLLLTMLIVPLSFIGIDKPIGDTIGELREVSQETKEIPRWMYFFTQIRVIVTYIRLVFLPINQNLDYDYPIYHSLFEPGVFLSFLFLLSIFGFGVYLFYRSRHTTNLQNSNSEPRCSQSLHATRLIPFGILWFFITLSVESSIIPIRDVIFEHRVYLPSGGAIIAFSTAVFYVASQLIAKSANRKLSLRGALVTKQSNLLASERLLRLRLAMTDWIKATVYLLLTTIVIALSIATFQMNVIWQDGVGLWEDVVRKSPEKARGYYNLGKAYFDKGMTDKAIEDLKISLTLDPINSMVHNNLGIAYRSKGWIDKAIEHFLVAIRLKPDYADAHNNLGNAYFRKGLNDKAIEHFLVAIRLKPDYADAHNNLGNAYFRKGLNDKAIEHFLVAIRLKPDYADAHFNLGLVYLEKRIIDKARSEFEVALQINPDDYQARQFLNYIFNLNTKHKSKDKPDYLEQ